MLIITLLACGTHNETGGLNALEKSTTDDYFIHGSTVYLFGESANTLFQIVDASNAFNEHAGYGRKYLYAPDIICVTDFYSSSCEITSYDISNDHPGFAFTVHGPRFDSAASSLFGALTHGQGIDPTLVTEVAYDGFVCAKDTQDVWCGLEQGQATLELELDGLEDLGDDYVYEGWLITSDGPVSSGRFGAPDTGAVRFSVDTDVADDSSLFVLTIEPAVGDDPAPAATHILAGEFGDGEAMLTVDHPAALGTDFTAAKGGFILETPSSADPSDYDQGVWFLDPNGPAAGLDLPVLVEGWTYEGWVVTQDGPVSTGTFTDPADADSDAGGPAAGPEGTPPFPGQDFISPPLQVVGTTVVISVEPVPDNSPSPFTMKPLVGGASDEGPGTFQALENTMGDTNPMGFATLR